MKDIKERLNELKNERMSALAQYGLLGLETEYWRTRAELASRDVSALCDSHATDIMKGQILICYETADEAERTRDKLEENAKSKSLSAISEKGLSAV